MSKRKVVMPGFYGKNIAQNAQRRFLRNRERERREKRDPSPARGEDKAGAEQRAD